MCIICESKQDDWMNEGVITNDGFLINHTNDETFAL